MSKRVSNSLLYGFSILLGMTCAGVCTAALGDWVRWRSIVVGDGPTNAHTGNAIALSTDWLIVGVPGDTDAGGSSLYLQSGAVLVYAWGNGGWQPRYNVRLSDIGGTPQTNAHFGAALSLSANRVLVGCPGCAYGWHGVMLDLSGATMTAFPIPLWGAEEEVADHDLGAGSAVALDDSTVAIGSPLAQPFGASGQVGMVDIGHLSGNAIAWDHAFRGEQAGSRFGAALSLAVIDTGGTIPMHTTWLAVGAPTYVNTGSISLAGLASEAGSAYRFERRFNGSQYQWLLQQRLTPRTGNEAFGTAVAMASARGAAIGAPDYGADDSGAVHLYLCDGIFIDGFDDANGMRCDRF